MRLLGVTLFLLLSACTKRNPHVCADGLCTDPSYPFCDVDGTLGGEPKECIAVACTPGEFEACQADDELRCNTSGNNYDQARCELGCSAATNGCKLCEPNETRCTNGKVATCDADGAIASMEDCPLGCFEDQPRCRNVNPSNNLAGYLDMSPTLPDIDLENVTINTFSGVVTNNVTNQPIQGLLTFMESTTTSSIRVFVANRVHLRDVTAGSGSYPPLTLNGPSVAFVARGPILVEGFVKLSGGAGGRNDTACAGGLGGFRAIDNNVSYSRGAGGGGNATSGGPGGSVNGVAGGAGGQVAGTDTLEPLLGGCASGGVTDEIPGEPSTSDGYPGGGALQLTSNVSVELLGKIDVRGSHGESFYGPSTLAIFGGGAGGSVLIEAPKVTLGTTAKIIAKGGGGGAAYDQGYAEDDTAAPSLGSLPSSACAVGECGKGGDGAAPGFAAGPGQSVTSYSSGGGGGGLGRLRVNTKDGTYTKANTAVEAAVTTTGIVKTR
jgi:hypothetical protein